MARPAAQLERQAPVLGPALHGQCAKRTTNLRTRTRQRNFCSDRPAPRQKLCYEQEIYTSDTCHRRLRQTRRDVTETVPGSEVFVYADRDPLPSFTVKIERTHIVEKDGEQLVARHKKVGRPQDRIRWAPIFENMATQIVATTLDGAQVDNGPPPQPYSGDFWSAAFKRILSRHRHPQETEFLWMFVHRAIWTNGIKAQFTFAAHHPSAHCRRCLLLHSDSPPSIETRILTFYFCPTVKKVWDDLGGWIETLQPGFKLDKDPVAVILG